MPIIRILVNTKTRDVTAWPTCATVHAGDKVRWELHIDSGDWKTQTLEEIGGSFLLAFPDAAPVGGAEIRGASKRVEGGFTTPAASVEIRPNALGVFHYRVAARVGEGIYADMGCPSIKTE